MGILALPLDRVCASLFTIPLSQSWQQGKAPPRGSQPLPGGLLSTTSQRARPAKGGSGLVLGTPLTLGSPCSSLGFDSIIYRTSGFVGLPRSDLGHPGGTWGWGVFKKSWCPGPRLKPIKSEFLGWGPWGQTACWVLSLANSPGQKRSQNAQFGRRVWPGQGCALGLDLLQLDPSLAQAHSGPRGRPVLHNRASLPPTRQIEAHRVGGLAGISRE